MPGKFWVSFEAILFLVPGYFNLVSFWSYKSINADVWSLPRVLVFLGNLSSSSTAWSWVLTGDSGFNRFQPTPSFLLTSISLISSTNKTAILQEQVFSEKWSCTAGIMHSCWNSKGKSSCEKGNYCCITHKHICKLLFYQIHTYIHLTI